MTDTAHSTIAECSEDKQFIPGPDRETVVKERTEDGTHTQTVACPACGREYSYLFERAGVFNLTAKEYDVAPDDLELLSEKGYYGGKAYSVPAETSKDREVEVVYVLERLVHDGDTVATF